MTTASEQAPTLNAVRIAPDSLAPATALLRDDFLETNVRALGLGDTLLEKLRATPRDARVQARAEHGALLTVGGRVLGGPADRLSDISSLRSVDGTEDVVVVLGLGMGELAARARQRTTAPIIVYEPNLGALRGALEYGPLSLGGAQVVTDRDGLLAAWPRTSRTSNATLIRTCGYAEAFPGELAAVTEMVNAARLHQALCANTLRERGRTWVNNLVDNLPVLTRAVPFAVLENEFAGVPAFIVGAGPSLGKNVEQLVAASARGLVIATNSSVRTLHRAGVEPQVVACLEAADMSPVLGEVPFIDRAIRAFSLTAHPNTIACGKGPLLPVWEYVHGLVEVASAITGLPGLKVSASVSTLAVSLAILLGCDPIVIVGHDLAYTNGRMYSSDSPFAESHVEIDEKRGTIRLVMSEALREARTRAAGANGPNEVEHLCVLPAWGGAGKVASGPNFLPVQRWFSETAKLHPTRRFINATEGGAHVPGFSEQTLADVLSELPERQITPEQIREQALGKRKPLEVADLCAWARREKRPIRELYTAARALEKSALHARRMIASEQMPAIRSALNALDDAEDRLRSAGQRVPLFGIWSQSPIDAALEDGNRESAEIEQSIAKERRVAKAIAQSALELEGVIERLLRRD